jgi:hypothetical protein
MESSDFTTTSLGEFRRLPFHFSAITEIAGHAAREMLARDKPALIVDGIAVRIVRGLAEDRDFTGGFDEPHHAIVRNVRPDQIAARREPGRTFSPARPRPQALDAHVTGETSFEARIENDDVRPLDLTMPHRNLRLPFNTPELRADLAQGPWQK